MSARFPDHPERRAVVVTGAARGLGRAFAEIAAALGVQPFQGRQIFRWIHKKQAFNFEEMTDLSKPLRAKLLEEFCATPLELVQTQISERTGTKKVLVRLPDGETGIRKTVQWYLDNAEWVKDVQSGSYRDWVSKQYGA